MLRQQISGMPERKGDTIQGRHISKVSRQQGDERHKQDGDIALTLHSPLPVRQFLTGH